MALVGKSLGETQVNGRSIIVFRLHNPVYHGHWRVDAIELPAPKEGVKTRDGLEHVEFVLFDDIEHFLKKYSHKQFELRAARRGINPEVGFKLQTYGVKFHLLNLPTVLYLQNKLDIHTVQDDS